MLSVFGSGRSGAKDDATGIDHTSTCSAIARASSTSIPKYREHGSISGHEIDDAIEIAEKIEV